MASKRHIRRRQCEGKRRFESYESALRFCFDGMRPYYCVFCRGYHVGHVAGAKQEIVKASWRWDRGYA